MKRVILAYVPVLHRGYVEFFKRHPDALALYVMGQTLIDEFDPLSKDIRALSPEVARIVITSLGLFDIVAVADHHVLSGFRAAERHVVMPDEDVSHELAAKYLTGVSVEFDRVFLRWDRPKSLEEESVSYDRAVPLEGLIGEMMGRAIAQSVQSSDWWRQVGAVIARDGDVLLAGYNRHVPSPHILYLDGDPRANFSRGVNIELSTAHHAEARLIAEAARKGIALEGTDLYVTTFPCPVCAKQIAYAGIKRLFFLAGYAMLDGERILRSQGVEIIKVKEAPTP
jgi:dCMP deaminase